MNPHQVRQLVRDELDRSARRPRRGAALDAFLEQDVDAYLATLPVGWKAQAKSLRAAYMAQAAHDEGRGLTAIAFAKATQRSPRLRSWVSNGRRMYLVVDALEPPTSAAAAAADDADGRWCSQAELDAAAGLLEAVEGWLSGGMGRSEVEAAVATCRA